MKHRLKKGAGPHKQGSRVLKAGEVVSDEVARLFPDKVEPVPAAPAAGEPSEEVIPVPGETQEEEDFESDEPIAPRSSTRRTTRLRR